MVYQQADLDRLIGEFIERVQKSLSVQKIVLFGSYAYGEPHDGSDIDLLVVSEDFKGMDQVERVRLLMGIARQLDAAVDIGMLGFTPHEYASISPLSTLSIAKTKGRVIYPEESHASESISRQ